MPLTDKKVAILVDNYFEQAEFERPLKAMRSAGLEVDVVAVHQKSLQALNHVEWGDKFTADLLLDEANPEDYDALVLPGGVVNADAMRIKDEVQRWATDFLGNGKLLAAICHAPWILISADIVSGRRLTSFYTIQDDVRNAGGDWVDQALVIDSNLITSRKPDDLDLFTHAILVVLAQPETADNFVEMDEAEPTTALLGNKGGAS